MREFHPILSARFRRALTRRIGGDVKAQVVTKGNGLAQVVVRVSYTETFVIDKSHTLDKASDGVAKGMMNYIVERVNQSAKLVGNMYQIQDTEK